MTSPLLCVSGINALLFGCQAIFTRHYHLNDVYAGALSGSLQAFIACPMEYVKLQRQLNVKLNVKFKVNDVKRLYKGLTMTMIRDGLGFASYFSVFNALTHSNSHSFGGILVIGGLTGSLSWFISYPFDVIKTHIQINNSFNDIMSKFRSNPMQFLFKGLFITLLRAFLVNSMTFTTVHYILIHCD